MDIAAWLCMWTLSLFFNFGNIRSIEYPIVLEIKILEDDHIRRAIMLNQTDNSKLKELAKQKHLQKLKEVTEHINEHFLSTIYLYSEMKKIKQRGVLMDKARRMLRILESLEGTTRGSMLKRKLLKCWNVVKLPKEPDPIQFENNNLVIHYVKDLYNYNYD